MAAILIIEDQDYLGVLYQRVLGSMGHEVTVAQNGQDGIAAAENKKPDLVFLDLTLPGMTASEIVEQLTRVGALPDSPLVIATAMEESQAKALAPSLGAAAVLIKPFDIQAILDLVHSLLPTPNE